MSKLGVGGFKGLGPGTFLDFLLVGSMLPDPATNGFLKVSVLFLVLVLVAADRRHHPTHFC